MYMRVGLQTAVHPMERPVTGGCPWSSQDEGVALSYEKETSPPTCGQLPTKLCGRRLCETEKGEEKGEEKETRKGKLGEERGSGGRDGGGGWRDWGKGS